MAFKNSISRARQHIRDAINNCAELHVNATELHEALRLINNVAQNYGQRAGAIKRALAAQGTPSPPPLLGEEKQP